MHERILLLPSTNEYRARFLDFLGDICSEWYDITHVDHLHQAVCAYGDALRDDPGVVTYLADRAIALYKRFGRLGDPRDINESVALLKEALVVSPSNNSCLINLGSSLQSRFARMGDAGDITEAISVFRRALASLPESHPNRPACLHNLGNAFHERFRKLGDLGDLNQSLSMLEEAAKLHPSGNLNKVKCLCSLGSCLQVRFERLGDLGDLHHSVSVLTEAVRLSLGETKISCLARLGSSLRVRFERLGNLDDMNQTVEASKEAVKLCPKGHPNRSDLLNNFGLSLRCRFDLLGNPGDLDETISMFKEAVDLLPDNHPNKMFRLTNLGNCLKHLFLKSGKIGDLNDAIVALNEAVCLCPENHPHRASLLINVGSALHKRFSRFGHASDYEKSLAAFASAACSSDAPASVRFQAAIYWAQLPQFQKFKTSTIGASLTWDQFMEDYEHSKLQFKPLSLTAVVEGSSESMPAYSVALDLLPELSWLGLPIGDRHHDIETAGKVARDAVGTAVAAQQHDRAVEWFEQGRSVIWGQILGLRTPVDALKKSHPNLAEKFILLSMQLEDAGTRDTSTLSPWMEPLPSGGQRYHEAAHARNLLLQQIRTLDGFDRFLLPKRMTQLSLAAARGPVVILSISAALFFGCALVLMPKLDEEVLHIPLPNLTMMHAETLAESLRSLLRDSGRGERLDGWREGKMAPEAQFAFILSELWERIAKPVLEGLGHNTPSSETPQRIWWCPTGPLAFLPIHAAGLYGEHDGFGSKLSDFVISSYTPSLTALIQGFRGRSHSEEGLKLLAVAQPSADGQGYIPGTEKEIDDVKRLAQSAAQQISVLRLDGNAATLDSVRKGMKESRWVHFACHGVQNLSTPTESALLLAGSSRLTLSDIIKLSIPHADLAFLSACQTATGAKGLEEESVHLAAGMLLAGYRGVIATMWSITDDDAPHVAADVYEHLFKTSPPDPTRAAEALHFAVKKLREGSEGKKSFYHWVPFIHVGV
ncbi:CHAT domain-containing protein [Mycena epipterygia]|nr:CHAT domain-containing protein [Mycena epipterygia]